MSTWVDDFLLAGPDDEVCLRFAGPVRRGELRHVVGQRQNLLRDMGIGPIHSVVMQQPASLDHVATALAVWRLGAQLVTVDHRVTPAGLQDVVNLMRPRAIVTDERIIQCPMWTPRSDHLLVQVTSGSTGKPKAVGRRFADLVGEVMKTGRLPGMPSRGESMIVLAAFAHTYGLFAGLLHGLHSGAEVVVPEHLTARGIHTAAAQCAGPVSIFGVPFHVRMLAAGQGTPGQKAPGQGCPGQKAPGLGIRGLRRIVSSGERLDQALLDTVTERLGVPVGQIYGMTETGMIAGDLDGTCRPAVGRLASGVEAHTSDSELLVRMRTSPYLGRTEPAQWQAGWFCTGDAASLGPNGLITLHGRLDSQATIGGLKVDLVAVEQIMTGMAGVAEAVVVNDGVVKAYVVLRDGGSVDTEELHRVLAPHQRPRVIHTVPSLPRTPSGKAVRNVAVLEGALV